MTTSELIARFISELMNGSEDTVEIRRNELAGRFNCVPSQINYVIETRFTPEHGYVTESRRGGGGYIRITRLHADRAATLMHIVNAVRDTIDQRSVTAFLANMTGMGMLDVLQARLIAAACSDGALRRLEPPHRDEVRASVFKQCLLALREDGN